VTAGPSIGDKIDGRYELRDQLGSCASRDAYRAFDTEVEVEVALWCVRPELFSSEEERKGFIEAVSRVRALKHRHLLRVFAAAEFEAEEGKAPSLYLTQQLGTSAELEGRLQAGVASDPVTILRYAEGLAAALEAAHREGLHHGWMSPADVVEVAGQVKLCGVGLFAKMDANVALPLWEEDRRYLAPEVAAGGEGSAASDWYSLAVILLELANGTPASSVEESLAALAARSAQEADALRSALREEPKERPKNAQEFLQALRFAWSDPDTTIEDRPPAKKAPERNPGQHALLGPNADVPVRSFLDDDDDETAMHRAPPEELMVSEVEGATAVPITDEEGNPLGLTGDDVTVVEKSPELRIEALSMKPNSPVGVAKKEPMGLPVKPVLRPLASLGGGTGNKDLGKLAPPRALTEEPRSNNYWLMVVLALLAGAVSVSLFLILTSSSSQEESEADEVESEPAMPEPTTKAPAPRELLVLGPRCPEDMVLLEEEKLCVDAHEAPGRGRQPQSGLALDDAAALCAERGARLCTGAEWESACRSEGGGSWPYGDRFRAEICNLKGSTIEVTGNRSECRSSFGVYDMSGNIAEWVAEGQIRGGSALDRTKGRCSQLRSNPTLQLAYSDVGFRCCADAIASQVPSD
jgi:serine/threonine protein kinase